MTCAVTKRLLSDIIQDRQESDRIRAPVVFLAADEGGALVKHLLIATHAQNTQDAASRALHACIHGFAFFSGNHSVRRPNRWDATPNLDRTWRHNNRGLQLADYVALNTDFQSLCNQRIAVVCFHEYDETSWGLAALDEEPTDISPSICAENVPLKIHRSRLMQFASCSDASLMIVLKHLRELSKKASKHHHLPGKHSGGLRLLSLDGGGVRGLFSVMVLGEVLKRVQAIEKSRGYVGLLPKPCDVFDLIGGTSTGGLIAIMLSRLEMDTAACKNTYLQLSAKIFGQGSWWNPFSSWTAALSKVPKAAIGRSWYSGDALAKAMKDTISECEPKSSGQPVTDVTDTSLLYDETDIHDSADLKPLASKCFVCAIKDAGHECVRLRAYPTSTMAVPPFDELQIACKIWEAGRATSAAPLYFPPMQIGGHRFFDGGMQSNDPILEVVDEAYQLYGQEAPIQAVVSIGAGASKSLAPSGGAYSVINSVVARTTETEGKHREFVAKQRTLLSSYFRLQEYDLLGSIDLAALKELPRIEQLTEAYIQSETGKKTIEDCAKKLCRL